VIKKLVVATALAAVTMMAIPSDPADARRGHGFSGGGARFAGARGPSMRAPVMRSRVFVSRPAFIRHRPRVGRRIFVGPVYGGYRSCEWLRRRAIITGSRYWWRRYYLCRGYW
jgi:hypothetical protein